MKIIKGKVVLFETDDVSSNISLSINSTLYYIDKIKGLTKPQHLYITSNEEIKEGDWVVETRNNSLIIAKIDDECEIAKDIQSKVIATADKSLNLPSIPQSFIDTYIEEYNKGNVIEDIEIEYSKKDRYRDELNEELRPVLKGGINYAFGDTVLGEISIILPNISYTKEDIIKYSYWLRETSFNINGYPPEICFNEWLKQK